MIASELVDVRAARFGCNACGDTLRIEAPADETFDMVEVLDTAEPWIRAHWVPRLLSVDVLLDGTLTTMTRV